MIEMMTISMYTQELPIMREVLPVVVEMGHAMEAKLLHYVLRIVVMIMSSVKVVFKELEKMMVGVLMVILKV